jgi:hypothetical protein
MEFGGVKGSLAIKAYNYSDHCLEFNDQEPGR